MGADYAARAITPNNAYTFRCPVVDRDALFMGCHYMQVKHWRGEQIPCADCATAMTGGKCPAVQMIKMEQEGEATFFDAERRMHALPAKVIEHVANILLFPFHAKQVSLTPAQTARLFANAPLDGAPPKGAVSARATAGRRRAPSSALPTATLTPSDDRLAGIDEMKTDRAAQINQAMEKR